MMPPVAVSVAEYDMAGVPADSDAVTTCGTGFTVCVINKDALLLSFVSPPYKAVIECDPTVSAELL
jgi:hypothetical protein